jgi:Cu/Ag efflux protein CusF
MRIFFVALTLLFVFPLHIIAANSAAASQTAEKKTEKKAREKTANGVVKVIDTASKVIVIQGRDELAFSAEETLLKEINVNDKVIIKYTEKGGKKFANSIKLDSKKRSKK